MIKSSSFKNCLSKIFQPITVIPKDANVSKLGITSKSQRLMLELGVIHQANPGCFHLLPLGIRSLEKLIKIIDKEMIKINGQKLILPTLVNKSLWKTSGRLEETESELFQLKDRHQHEYLLCPTQEESITSMIASIAPVTYKQFPMRLYQITSKFRDEIKPRFGLMRSREFIMKDMYTFDVDKESAKKTYEEVNESYDQIFKKIGLDYIKVLGTSGNIGGSVSHEYHFKADIGEDKILTCGKCGYLGNVELCGDSCCPKCNSNDTHLSSGIEIGHTFLLGDKYSKPLKATFLNNKGKPTVLEMGCYGIGVTRILAASLEVLSLDQEIRWPDSISPFNVIILPPKRGSKEEGLTIDLVDKLYSNLEEIEHLKDNVLIDDRLSETIGRRFLEAKRFGYRYIIVIGKKATENIPLYELNDLKYDKQLYLTQSEVLSYIKENTVF